MSHEPHAGNIAIGDGKEDNLEYLWVGTEGQEQSKDIIDTFEQVSISTESLTKRPLFFWWAVVKYKPGSVSMIMRFLGAMAG